MDIAFFCDAYKPTRNGVAVSVATTAEELRKRGHHVVIFAPRYKDYRDGDPDVVRFPAGHWPYAKDFSVAWPLLVHLSAAAKMRFHRESFDVVHTHSPFTIGALGVHWARHRHIPTVFTFHTLYHRYLHYAPLPRVVTRPYTSRRVRQHCHLSDHIIAPSKQVARIVQHFRHGAPCTVLGTGIDVERFSRGDGEAVRAHYGIAPDEIVLLYVGRLAKEKNLEFLLRAVAPLLGGNTVEDPTPTNGSMPRGVRLMLVGGGPAIHLLKDLAAHLHILQHVIFTDFIDTPAIPDHYAAGNIFTFASRTETQGVSITEALAAGLPCVVVGAMGAAESIKNGQNGFIVPPHEVRFREAAARLVRDAVLREELAANARQTASMLSLERSVDKLIELYQSLLHSSSSAQ